MRLCFLVPDLSPSGGVNVVRGHAERLAARGLDVEIVLTEPGAALPDAPVPVRPLASARSRVYDVVFATWWRTAPLLWETAARRRAVFLQSLEHRFYQGELFDSLAAESVLSLPVAFVTVARWLADDVERVRPDVRCHVVRNGVDKGIFTARARRRDHRGRLRVLIEGQPTLWFKGVAEAIEAARAMAEPAHVTLVCLDPNEAAGLPVDRVVGGLDARGMAALYSEVDVLVKLSRLEGLGMAPVEAFHAGVPCVVWPYPAHAEYVDHGGNGLVAEFDDVPAVTGWLDLLARDRELLARLSAGAARKAETWPSVQRSTDELEAALEAILSEPAPDVAPSWAALYDRVAIRCDLGAESLRRLAFRAEWAEKGLREAQAHVAELSKSRDECAELLDDARRQLEAIRSTSAYRIFAAARRAGRTLRR